MSKRESVLFVIFLVLSSIALNDTYGVVNAKGFLNNNEFYEDEMISDKEDSIYLMENQNTSEKRSLENSEENDSAEINENQVYEDSNTELENLEDEQADMNSEEEEETTDKENISNKSAKSSKIQEKETENSEQASFNSQVKQESDEERTIEVPVNKPVEEKQEKKEVEKEVEKEVPVEEPKEVQVEESKAEPVEEVKEETVESEQNTGYFISSIEQEILKYTNEERVKNGLEPLVWESKINPIARFKAEDMLKNNYFAHPTPSLGNINCLKLAQHFGYGTSSYGENLFTINVTGANVLNYTSAKSMVNSWMNSPGHRENILRTEWKKFSAGVICSDDNTIVYSVQHFSVD